MEVRLKVNHGSTALADKDSDIVAGSLQGLWLTAQKYPVTLGVSLALDGVSITSPEGTIASSGIQKENESDEGDLTLGEAQIFPQNQPLLLCRQGIEQLLE